MFDIISYNDKERKNLASILRLEEIGQTQGISQLNPLRYKDHSALSSPFDYAEGFERKLPLDESDSYVIDSIASFMPEWRFKQLRTRKSDKAVEYAFILRHIGDISEEEKAELSSSLKNLEYTSKLNQLNHIDLVQHSFFYQELEGYRFSQARMFPEVIRKGNDQEINFNYMITLFNFIK